MAQRQAEVQKKKAKWRCTVCGYEHEGPDAPDRCPRCGAPKTRFVRVTSQNL